MIGLEQFIPGDSYDALVGANAASAANVVATVADIVGGNGYIGEVSSTSDIVTTLSATIPPYVIPQGPFILASNSFPVNAAVQNGRSRKMQWIFEYTKSGSAATITYSIVMGGTTLTFNPESITGSTTSDTVIVDLYMNFRAGTAINATAIITRFNNATGIVSTRSIQGGNVWDKTISNNIDLRVLVNTGSTSHGWRVKQISAALT
jgi:hypothetical protein